MVKRDHGSGPLSVRSDAPIKKARAASVVTWVYVAGFGLPAVPVAVYLVKKGRLPSFLGLFEMYGGPWSAALEPNTFAIVLVGFFVLTAATAWAAWKVWKGLKTGAVILLALLAVQSVFWVGFALPFTWPAGIAAAVLLALGWKDLKPAERAG